MGESTHISWCDHTFNPWLGCMRISNGPLGACAGCYAAVVVEDRFGRAVFGGPGKGVGTRARTSPSNWKQPLAWNRQAVAEGRRAFVFCASLADVFDNEPPAEWREDLFALIRATPALTWLLLTKRPGNIVDLFRDMMGPAYGEDGEDAEWYLPDVWPKNAAIGCTIVTQEEADRDIPKLLAAKAALHPAFAFVSMEPLMGPVNLHPWLLGFAAGHPAQCAACGKGHGFDRCPNYGRVSQKRYAYDGGPVACHGFVHDPASAKGLDWVITGGETDQGAHKARPSHPQWFRDLRDQCAAAGVPFHHKQNGEWVSVSEVEGPGEHYSFPDGATVRRTGKKRSGRTLDGVVHDGMPA